MTQTQAQRHTISALGGMPVRPPAAMQGLATGNREGKPAEREQQTYTPLCLKEMLETLAGGRIALDPCSGPGSILNAIEAWEGTRVQKTDAKGRPKFRKDGSPMLEWTGPGLERTWLRDGLVYCNEPYNDLQAWLAKAQHEACTLSDTATGIVLLGPVRPHRKWWRTAWNDADARAWLDPLTFGGWDQSFPAPLCLWYWGARPQWFAEVFEASELGEMAT